MVEQYPASVTIPEQSHYGRFWAVPVLGNGVKGILAIPHNFLLYFVQIWVLINQLVLWIPVLTNGEYSPRGARLMTGYFRWQTRLAAWLFGLSDKYPPFGFSEEHPVDVQVTIGSNYNRFWAFPVIGLGVKNIILIPHTIALSIMAAVLFLGHIVIWIPVLFTGRYPEWGRKLTGGVIAWSVRYQAFLWGLTDKYPPFSMAI